MCSLCCRSLLGIDLKRVPANSIFLWLCEIEQVALVFRDDLEFAFIAHFSSGKKCFVGLR